MHKILLVEDDQVIRQQVGKMLSVNVARLRKKLEEQGLVGFIETKKGIGYGLKHAWLETIFSSLSALP